MQKRLCTLALIPVLGLAAGCGSSSTPTATPTPAPTIAAVLYTETNAPAAANGTSVNAVLAYTRGTDGSLTSLGSFPTTGNGEGLPTTPGALPFPIGGATGAVTLSPDGTHLYAVDAGSNDVAGFTVASNGALTLIATYPTGGMAPGSITIDATGKYLYVLNTGSTSDTTKADAGSITGFTIAANGSLTPIAKSTQMLSAATYVDPSQVGFSPDGTYLVVTEKGAPVKLPSLIDLFPVAAGVAGPVIPKPSTGNIPFGFGFTKSGKLIVSNAESPKSLTASTVSSYTADATGNLTAISGAVPDNQGAACWIAITSDDKYAYTTNTLSGSVSGYAIGSTGTLTLLSPDGIVAPQTNTTGAIDLVVSPGNKYLYVLNSMGGKAPGEIASFTIGSNGSLTSVPTTATGLLPGSIGLAVR